MLDIFKRLFGKLLHLSVIYLSMIFPKKGKILMFHSIGDARHEFNMSINIFEKLLQSLKKENVVRLEEWESHNDYFCLTFDDVPDSFYYNALPLLKKYKIPFTIFVSCSLLDTEGFITSEMLKEIADCKLSTIGSHGWKHSYFVVLSREEAEKDLILSKETLEKLTRRNIDMYAFPYGSVYACGFSKTKMVSKYYKSGFGTIATSITKPSLLPNYYLPRIVVTDNNYMNII